MRCIWFMVNPIPLLFFSSRIAIECVGASLHGHPKHADIHYVFTEMGVGQEAVTPGQVPHSAPESPSSSAPGASSSVSGSSSTASSPSALIVFTSGQTTVIFIFLVNSSRATSNAPT
jgi:hypothetical protein